MLLLLVHLLCLLLQCFLVLGLRHALNDLRSLRFMISCGGLHTVFVLVMRGMIAGCRVVTLLCNLVEDVVWGVLF